MLQCNRAYRHTISHLFRFKMVFEMYQTWIKLFCRKDNENVKLEINIKLANYSPQIKSLVYVELKQVEESIAELIPFNGAYKIRGQQYNVSGKEWTLRYRDGFALGRGKFWIQIKGTGAQISVNILNNFTRRNTTQKL